MANNNGTQDEPQAGAGLLPSIPAMPRVAGKELYRGAPNLLQVSGVNNSLGWQDHSKSGPTFVVARLRWLGSIKVTERFPLTEQGWAAAWQALSGRDAKAAASIQTRLAAREAADRATATIGALNAESLSSLRVTFNGGSGDVPLAKGEAYDLRFLGERVVVCPPRLVDPIIQIPYSDVEAVDVSGPGLAGKSPAELAALIAGLGLLGALLGFLIFNVVGLFLGALVFGLVGGLIGGFSSKIETIVRIRGRDTELYFMNDQKGPDALRIELSDPLMAIRSADAGPAAGSDQPAETESGSIPDQLTKLATLLQQGLITRDEFEHLKAKLMTAP